MTLHAASREALSAAESRLDEVLRDAGTEASVVGEELLAVAVLLDTEVALRRAVADGSSEVDARRQLLRGLLNSKISEPALQIVDSVVSHRWSAPRESVDGLESLGQSALLTSAEKLGSIDAVEDQLFRVARIVSAEPELERALSDKTAPRDAKRKLIRNLFADKVDAVVELLVEQVVLRDRTRAISAELDALVALAADRRDRSVAYVTSAVELSEAQRGQLADTLRRMYQRDIAMHVEVDPALIGGMRIRVGDEVIDGTAAGRLDALRRQLV